MAFKPFGRVEVSGMVAWIAAIPFESWPQQRRLADGKLRPAMVTDLAWHGFGDVAWPIVSQLGFDETQAHQLMLSVVMPGHSIPLHRDEQARGWLFRVHIPLLTNSKAVMTIDGKRHKLKVGTSYKINTKAEHAIENRGSNARVHFMFDIRGTNDN